MTDLASRKRYSDPISTPDRLDRSDRIALGALIAVIAVVYFALFNHDFSVNGLRYADDVERGIELFHPNHLLPNLLWRGFYLIAQAAGAGWRSAWLMQSLNIIAGALTAAAVARVALSRGERHTALLVGALYAFGFAAWSFAEEPDVYVLPATAVAASLAIILPRRQLAGRDAFVLGLLAVFAVLTLQQYVFWYPALLALAARRGIARGHFFVLALGVPAACLGAYLLVGVLEGRLHGLDDVLGWFFGYAWNGRSGFGTYRPAPAFVPRMLGGLFGLANLVFAYEIILSPAALFSALLALAVPVLLIALRTAGTLRRGLAPLRGDAGIVLLWSAVNLAFAVWWESRNIEFLFPVWLGWMTLVALASPALDRRLLGAAPVLIAGVNIAVAFGPQRHWPPRYAVAAELARHEHLGAGDVLITEELNTVGYLNYFEHVDVRFQPGAISAAMQAPSSLADVRRAIDMTLAHGQRVYTTELDEHGRLDAIARWFAPLGRSGFDGALDRDLQTLYRDLDVSQRPVPGVRRVLPIASPR